MCETDIIPRSRLQAVYGCTPDFTLVGVQWCTGIHPGELAYIWAYNRPAIA